MKFYNRNGKLYLEQYIEGKWDRKSLFCDDTPDNRAMWAIKLGMNRKLKAKAKFKPVKKQGGGVVAQEWRIKVAFVVDQLMETYAHLKETSQTHTRQIMDRVLELLDHPVYMGEIDKPTLHQFYNKLAARGYARSYTSAIIKMLQKLLDFAMVMDYIDLNPFFKRKLKTPTPSKKKPLSDAEVTAIISTCKPGIFCTYLVVAIFTGARMGEILALRRSDIDFERNTIRIERAINQLGKITTPKTESSIRTIEMPDPVKSPFEAH
ncbi:tyrosine-type recombinase/integrase [Helicobacter mehlei]|uniref:Tyrosine-type recombinase/integrase n=1 Tax=Helicobacter mehlei TaxID=2316080 RepID=A0A553UJH9_9HELI|nr:phage integrase SAM-like domain-containing protein [Helicobacter mehlei]TSA80340.1 tyrosine-type recombinase/integrase [Helicobacter mehlei]